MTISELRALATARAEIINEAVHRRFGDIPTDTWVFHSQNKNRPEFWDINYKWTMVPTVTEPVQVTFYGTDSLSRAVTVWHEPHRLGLQLDESGMDMEAVKTAVIAALEKHESRRIDLARAKLEAAGLTDLFPLLDELQQHREWAQRHEKERRELRKSFKNASEYENHVKQSLRAAADRMEQGMGVYSARLHPLTEENSLMLSLDVTLSYPWPG